MTSPALLTTYRNVRDAVADIQQAASAVDEHLGRFQIYGEEEKIGQAITEAERIFAKVEWLEAELRRCTLAFGRRRKGTDQREAAPLVEVSAVEL